MTCRRLLIISDIHYSSPGEMARGHAEGTVIGPALLRTAAWMFRHYFWMRNIHANNHLLEMFLARNEEPDLVVATGDYSCDTAFVGVEDTAARESARLCLEALRDRFGERFLAIPGDHEYGKMSLFGGQGGPRVASLERAEKDLALPPFWYRDFDAYRLIGVASTLVALPVYAPECLPEELPRWWKLREEHMARIRDAFANRPPASRVILFCHDPTALPFLYDDAVIRTRLEYVDMTVIGHLHTELILWKSRLLAGMPTIPFLGNSIRRMSSALHQARRWRPFKVRLCPSLTGIELLKNPAFARLTLASDGASKPVFERVNLR